VRFGDYRLARQGAGTLDCYLVAGTRARRSSNQFSTTSIRVASACADGVSPGGMVETSLPSGVILRLEPARTEGFLKCCQGSAQCGRQPQHRFFEESRISQ
jgi:hypothetical protein